MTSTTTNTNTSVARPAIFFDRDGVLNQDQGYVYKIKDWQWIDGAINTIKHCNERNYFVFIVTNQSGIGRGFYSEQDVNKLHQFMQDDLQQYGANINDIRYCPHHQDAMIDKYQMTCNWRKPGPGMLLDLIAKWPIDRSRSVLVGDKESDITAAQQAGIKGLLFEGGNLHHFLTAAAYL